MIYPWQAKEWQQLWRSKQENRLPHAILLTGMSGIGKTQFANHFSQALLCQQVTAEGQCCEKCHACRLFAGNTHPNVLLVTPESAGHAIKVDQVRAVSDFVNQTSMHDGYRIVIIQPADAMNANAANALLKTLEEPSPDAIMILISHQPARLPATIRSRCLRMTFPRPQALSWLQDKLVDKTADSELLLRITNGAPLAALQLDQDGALAARKTVFSTLLTLSHQSADPIKAAVKVQELELLPVLDFILTWTMDLLRLQVNSDDIINTDYRQELIQLKQQTKQQRNGQFLEYVRQQRAQISAGINLNKQLLVECVFIRWMECVNHVAS